MRIIRIISKIFMVLCMVCIFVLMMLMVSEVLIRMIFNKSIVGSTEWAQILLLCNMTALSPAILSNRQIKINMVTSHLKPKVQVILDLFILALSCAVIAVIAWQQFKYTIKNYNNQVFYTSINIHQWPFVAVFSVAYAIGALTTLMLVIRKVSALITGNWDEEAGSEDLDEIFLLGKKKFLELKSGGIEMKAPGGASFNAPVNEGGEK